MQSFSESRALASVDAQLAKSVFQHTYAAGADHHFWIDKYKPDLKEEKRNMLGDQQESDLQQGVIEPNAVEECVAESESETINIPISSGAVGQMAVELRLEISCLLSVQETFGLINSYLGVDPKMDHYSFSATKKLDHITLVGCSTSEEMPTADEWLEAGVVNLMEKHELSLSDQEPVCPNLTLLFLQRNKGLTRIPASFFRQMPCLSFLDLSHTRIRELPQSLFTLKNLKVLLLRSCLCLDRFPPDIKQLINMEVLDLLGTDLYDMIPEEIGELQKLRHLHLSFYGPEYGSDRYADHISAELIPAGAISKLQALQALTIVVHPEDQRWKRAATNIIQNVAELNKLSYLQFYFPTVESLESFTEESLSWKELRLKRFSFIVGHNIKRIISRVPDEVESKYDQHERCLRFVNGDDQVPGVMKTMLNHVTAFYLDHHFEIRSLSEFGMSNFNELRFCVVRECPNMQTIGGEKSETAAFLNLEYLGLHYLWKLERIWEGAVPQGSFKEVKYLMVGTCPKLEHIASRSTLESLSKLETLIIEDCESLKSIVEENKMVKYKYDDTSLLPRLTKLVLRHLPELVTLGSGLFPSKKINISKHCCPKLTIRPRPSRRKLLVHHITAATSALIRDKLGKKFLQLHLRELA